MIDQDIAVMTPERFRRIRAIYEEAVDAPLAAREGLLDRECQGDRDIRKDVEELLGARERVPEWLAGPLHGPARAAVGDGDPTPGSAITAARVSFARER